MVNVGVVGESRQCVERMNKLTKIKRILPFILFACIFVPLAKNDIDSSIIYIYSTVGNLYISIFLFVLPLLLLAIELYNSNHTVEILLKPFEALLAFFTSNWLYFNIILFHEVYYTAYFITHISIAIYFIISIIQYIILIQADFKAGITHRNTVNFISVLILLVSISYSIIYVYQFKNYGWNSIAINIYAIPFTIFVFFFIFSFIISRINLSQTIHNYVFLNVVAILLLGLLIVITLSNNTGLWIEHVYRFGLFGHSSHELTRYLYFNPYVGIIGVYIASIGYCTYRYISIKNNIINGLSIWKELLVFVPLLSYFIILYCQEFMDKPYYNG